MKYTVVWVGTAERALTELWLHANDREAVTQAAEFIDDKLHSSPETSGESREFGQRILFAAPLGILYSIQSEDRLVRVLRVWQIRRRTR